MRKLHPIGMLVDVLCYDTGQVIGRGPIVDNQGKPMNGYTYTIAGGPDGLQWCRHHSHVKPVRAKKPAGRVIGYRVDINPHARTIGGLGWKTHMRYSASQRAEAYAELTKCRAVLGKRLARMTIIRT